VICQSRKELAGVCDDVINKFISFNIPITDTKGEHSLMVFMLERRGYTLWAKSCTRAIRHCSWKLDDAFDIDEILQELHTKCMEAIEASDRYSTDMERT